MREKSSNSDGTLSTWGSYQSPDPDHQPVLQSQYKDYQQSIVKYGKTRAIVGGVTCTILEGAELLRGMSRLFMHFVENEGFVNELVNGSTHALPL
jgi:hypothetical protein